MSAPVKQDAAFRWTENGQDYLHYLGSKLRRPVADTWQQVHGWTSPDGTTIRRIAIGSGVEDLRAQIRYDGMTDSLRRFMAAARRGAALEYFPSLANPSESYPCVLMSDDGIELDQDFWWNRRNAVNVVLRRIDSGNWLGVLVGSLFYWKAGNLLPGLVFTRSGTVGPYVGSNGLLQNEGTADVFRTDWVDTDGDGLVDAPTTLLGPAATNLVDEDDLTAWATSGTPVVTASVDDPAGGTDAFTVEDDDGAAVEYIERVVTFTDGARAVVFVVRENTMPASGVQALQIRDTTAGVNRLVLDITGWVNGEPTVAATIGSLLDKRPVGGGFWAVYGQAVGVVGSGSNRARLVPAGTSAQTGSIDVYRVNAFDTAIPPALPLDASGVLAAEKMTAPPGFTMDDIRAAGAVTFYTSWIERGTAYDTTTATRYWQVGNTVRLLLFSNTLGDGTIDATLSEVGGATAQSSPSAVIPIGSPAEARLVVYLDPADDLWKVLCGVSVDGAAEVLGSVATFGATLPDFDVDLMTFGSSHDATVQAPVSLEEIKVVRGVKTLAEMRAA
jgi:hypothetical protein